MSYRSLVLLVALIAIPVTLLAQGYGYEYGDASDEADPFAAFKENNVETGCLVPRFGDMAAYGNTRIGPEGGAVLTDEEAQQAYACALPAMRRGYAASELKAARDYTTWRRFAIAPYRSRRHNGRYVSNYANTVAAGPYSRYEAAGTMPVGSILAKDSFVVSEGGRVMFSALALMEKMPPGFNPEGGDWRFTLVLPDGRVFGRTGTSDGYAVNFCQKCHHKATPETDFLQLLPEAYRAR